jgi:hypothetical protein
MTDDTLLPFALPAVCRKKVTAAFDGGRLSADGGVLLLSGADRQLGLCAMLAGLIPDQRDQACITHRLEDILRARIFAIACGYPDGDDLDDLRTDPAFKLACGQLPESGHDLTSQPTLSRWENVPDPRTLLRLGYGMIDLWCRTDDAPPAHITLDIDDTVDVVHGHQQLSLFNAHYDERCFLPIHVYHAESGHCVGVLLRPGKTPSGKEIRGHLRRLIQRIRRHWPDTRITIRGDSHYGRPEVMDWCDANGVWFILGLSGNAALAPRVEPVADAVRTKRAVENLDAVRDWTEVRYAAKSWSTQRRVAARIEATRLGLDTRYVVTNIAGATAWWLNESLYCARGGAENLIKLHKAQLASDRTSCRSPLANQMRLILHTAAYWLVHRVRAAIPKRHKLAHANFATIRLRLFKIAARISEAATRVHLGFAASCTEAALFRALATALCCRSP